jgi:hypothetical protein
MEAALPPLHGILQRIVENNGGTSGFVIEQEVSLVTDSGSFPFKETWWIESEDKMSVQIRAPGFVQSSVFQNRQKLSIPSKTSAIKTSDWSDPVEQIFHFRKVEKLGSELVRQGILTPQSLQKKSLSSLRDLTYRNEARLRLSRWGGQLVFALGSPATEKSEPGLWVDQENFAIRRFRNLRGTEVLADDYSLFAGGIYLPKKRIYRWDQGSAQIQIIKVESRPIARLKNAFSDKENSSDLSQIPETYRDAFQNFLQRFR